ncbi:UDP-2,3-diacylglucosamine diphosphatase LpxI [Opitutaceae bacterium]|nr:UDP-2,3-diacylglucosamine diphosphatase LpxI [bacterium]MDB4385693.1 UDP-2,3-diacylglucosamine diphosphatase LpxI [Opitutaceae bacterium]
MVSRFLPADFQSEKPVTLIAGQGLYPTLVAEAIRASGIAIRLVAFEEETPTALIESFPETDRVIIKVGQIGKMLSALQKFKSGSALMAGQISPKRLFRGLHPDFKATRILFSLKRRNAETIFGAIAEEIENIGVKLLDARSFLDDHLAPAGNFGSAKFTIEKEYLDHGIEIARESARLDIGQGCVVRKGTVLAVEAYEGTDEMIRRAGSFKTDQTLFIKTVKANQDYRFDVPCFGLKTLETMRESGIRAAALEAGNVIVLDRPAVDKQARDWGISLFGFRTE